MDTKIKELKQLSLKLTSDIWKGIEAFESNKIKEKEILNHLNVCLTKYFQDSKEVIKKESGCIEYADPNNARNDIHSSALLNDLSTFKDQLNGISEYNHCTVRNDSFLCLNCGNQFKVSLPIRYDLCHMAFKDFAAIHRKCEKTYQDKVDPSLPPHLKAEWWLKNGEKNPSSKTMYQVLSGLDIGLKRYEYTHPKTVDDFNLCYQLVKTIPEWAALLNRLSIISPVWKKIVDNWDRLCLMLNKAKITSDFAEIQNLMRSLGC